MKQQNNQIEWKEFKLLEVIECIENGNRPKGGVGSLKEGIPSIGGEHINKNGGFDFSNIKFISKEFFEAQKRGIIQRGDVLVVKDGATTGRVTFISKDNFPYKEALVNEHVFILRPKNSMIVPKFLFYSLYGKDGQKKILDNFHGSAQGGINTQFAKNVLLYVPLLNGKLCLEEQERIVRILEKAEKLKERGKKAKDLLDEYLKSVFNEMFYNKGFAEKSIKELCEVISGSTPSTTKEEYWNGNIDWITPAELVDGDNYYYYESQRKITHQGLNSASTLFPKDTVMLTTRAPIGKVAIAGKEMCTNQGFKNMICKNELNHIYFYFWLLSHKNYLNSLGVGATFKEISKKIVENIKIPLPPLPLQQKFAKIVEQVEKLKENVKKTNKNSEELFNSLMQKAFKGEL